MSTDPEQASEMMGSIVAILVVAIVGIAAYFFIPEGEKKTSSTFLQNEVYYQIMKTNSDGTLVVKPIRFERQ